MKRIVITMEMTDEQFKADIIIAVLADLIADKAREAGIEHSCEETNE